MRQIVLIAHNLRSAHNVGSLLRTAEGLGVSVILTGYTPYPKTVDDKRLPHEAIRADKQISKVSLGAEKTLAWRRQEDIKAVLEDLHHDGFTIAALEQAEGSLSLPDFKPPDKLALIVGREVEGIESAVLDSCDLILEIPMSGHKESFNVAQAAAMALYHCRYIS